MASFESVATPTSEIKRIKGEQGLTWDQVGSLIKVPGRTCENLAYRKRFEKVHLTRLIESVVGALPVAPPPQMAPKPLPVSYKMTDPGEVFLFITHLTNRPWKLMLLTNEEGNIQIKFRE